MIVMPSAALSCLLLAAPNQEVPVIEVDRDNVQITESCRVRIVADHIADPDNNGVIHITGEDITVEFLDTPLRGATPEQAPDTYTGKGVHIQGPQITVTGLRVSGYKVGIHAEQSEGLILAHCDVSDNFRQHLKSTPQREDGADWLWPHANDNNEWMTNYGAGIYVEESARIEIHHIRARHVQNGIILDTINASKIYDNDCSFLSGWGLALWRSTNNAISRNAFDFCVRGYSHGVYNRGQDSAGILMFEQCMRNSVNHNSVTHGGDGLFAFAGREALGEVNPNEDESWYHYRGNNRNAFMNNDFSYAAAHGVELTFSFGNRIMSNRIVGNAICGIWGGYSQGMHVMANRIEDNGEMGYGLERGGVNIEHSFNNLIYLNHFKNNKCGVHLWWDLDEGLMKTPWAVVNPPDCDQNIITDNIFEGDQTAVHLRQTGGVTRIARNTMKNVGEEIKAEGDSPIETTDVPAMSFQPPSDHSPGRNWPKGARKHLRGREHIIMTEWGPYNWEEPLLVFDGQQVGEDGQPYLAFRLLGPEAPGDGEDRRDNPVVEMLPDGAGQFEVEHPDQPGVVWTGRFKPAGAGICRLDLELPNLPTGPAKDRRYLVWADWEIRQFVSPNDPREDAESWRAAAEGAAIQHKPQLNERYGSGGPGGDLPNDHFGTIATTTLTFPPGKWRIRTNSDDGIRVWLDGNVVIDDWTWHAPKEHTHEFTLTEARDVNLRIEHFELDGYAILTLDIEAAE